MKKTPLLNSELSETIASLGHMDMLMIGDAGMPIPPGVRRIDLALTKGIPAFLETLAVTVSELQVESIIVAEETAIKSPQVMEEILKILPGVVVRSVSHAELKEISRGARAAVRTGEFTPYANVILVAGVVF